MGELRKDYVLDRWVIIATERAKRPDQFKKPAVKKGKGVCYFCPGNEDMTPPEIMRKGDWDIRVFPNKFPAVRPEGKSNIATDNQFYTYSDAFGYHEVVVESPHHDKTLADISEKHFTNYLKILSKRISVNRNSDNIEYVSVFKNHGSGAGTSIEHTHSQIISLNKVPPVIMQKEHKCEESCPYCRIIQSEKDSLRRAFENPCFVAFTPYASRFPFEIAIFPKRHILSIENFTEEEYTYLASMMKKILLKLKALNADYNFYLQYGIKNMHFHIEITPRLATWAGFEMGTEMIINTMTPEDAAEFYRNNQ